MSSDDLEIRTLTVDELPEVVRFDGVVWGHEVDEARMRCFREFLEPDRTWGVFDGSRLVATEAVVGLRLTVPGGAEIDLAGFTWLMVHPLYQGRGLRRLLSKRALDRVRADGLERVAGGMPHASRSEPRDGPASRYADVELEIRGQRALRGVTSDGRLDSVDLPRVLSVLRDLSDRFAGVRNGWVPRKRCGDVYKYSRATQPLGGFGPASFVTHHAPDGTVDGLVGYRLASGADTYGSPEGTLKVLELLGTSADVEAQLWQHCMANPLVNRIVAARRPLDDPVAQRLPDPRAWHQVVRDDMHLEVLDVAASLSARRYSREDAVVLDVRDVLDEEAAPVGTFRLEGGLDGATCEPVDGPADLTMSMAAVASAYLGDVTLDRLAAAGVVVERTPGMLRRAAAMFSWSPPPWIIDSF